MLLERVLDLLGTHGAAPFDLHLMRHHPVGGEQLAPSLAELAAIDEDGVLAGREQVDDRGLHRAGAARREEDDFFPGAEQRLQALARLVERLGEFGGAMVNDRARHLEENLGRDGRGAGGEQIFF